MAAMENPRILSYVVDASEFPELSSQYGVRSVPQTVINGQSEVIFIGKYPEGRFVEELKKALNG